MHQRSTRREKSRAYRKLQVRRIAFTHSEGQEQRASRLHNTLPDDPIGRTIHKKHCDRREEITRTERIHQMGEKAAERSVSRRNEQRGLTYLTRRWRGTCLAAFVKTRRNSREA